MDGWMENKLIQFRRLSLTSVKAYMMHYGMHFEECFIVFIHCSIRKVGRNAMSSFSSYFPECELFLQQIQSGENSPGQLH